MILDRKATRLLQLSQKQGELVPPDTPIPSLAELQPLTEVSPAAQANETHIYYTHTDTQPLGDNGHEKCILLDSGIDDYKNNTEAQLLSLTTKCLEAVAVTVRVC